MTTNRIAAAEAPSAGQSMCNISVSRDGDALLLRLQVAGEVFVIRGQAGDLPGLMDQARATLESKLEPDLAEVLVAPAEGMLRTLVAGIRREREAEAEGE